MSQRTDWVNFTQNAFGDQPDGIPQHPRSNSIRSEVNTYNDFDQLGRCMPCMYYTPGFRVTRVCTAYEQSGRQMWASQFTYAVEQSLPSSTAFLIWDNIVQEFGDGPTPFARGFAGYYWESEDSGWIEVAVVGDRVSTRLFNAPLLVKPIDNLLATFTNVRPGPQCYLDPTNRRAVELPTTAPPKFPWPPEYHPWWPNGNQNTSRKS
jgi:hypothetical protein